MPLPKPASKPDWTVGNPDFGTVTIEPSGGKKQTGWTPSERPPSQFFNWLFYNLDQWVKYFESVVDEGVAGTALKYQAIVGSLPGCTHATLAAALADVLVVAGSKILVVESAAISAIIQVTKNDVEIEFHPRVTYSKASAATAIQVSADGVRITGGRFTGFIAGGNKAILIDAGSDYTMVRDSRFANNTLDIDDLASTSSISGTIQE